MIKLPENGASVPVAVHSGSSADPEGGTGVRTPLENHKLYGFL